MCQFLPPPCPVLVYHFKVLFTVTRFLCRPPGLEFRENSRATGRRSPAGGFQGSDPPHGGTLHRSKARKPTVLLGLLQSKAQKLTTAVGLLPSKVEKCASRGTSAKQSGKVDCAAGTSAKRSAKVDCAAGTSAKQSGKVDCATGTSAKQSGKVDCATGTSAKQSGKGNWSGTFALQSVKVSAPARPGGKPFRA